MTTSATQADHRLTRVLKARVVPSILCLLVLPLLSIQPLAAQGTYDLDPERWFPLDLGNYWHRTDADPITTDWIEYTSKDSVVDGERWTKIETLYCEPYGPTCGTPSRWYRFTEDHYLLCCDITDADTIRATYPISVFALDEAQEQLYSSFIQEQIDVTITTDGAVTEDDSTHFLLSIGGNIFTQGTFRYNIGSVGGLRGAIVNGYEFGDVSLIHTALPRERPQKVDNIVRVDVYPNPATQYVNIQVKASDQGHYKVALFNLLGQRIEVQEKMLHRGQTWSISFSHPLASGLYVVQVALDGRMISKTHGVIVLGE